MFMTMGKDVIFYHVCMFYINATLEIMCLKFPVCRCVLKVFDAGEAYVCLESKGESRELNGELFAIRIGWDFALFETMENERQMNYSGGERYISSLLVF